MLQLAGHQLSIDHLTTLGAGPAEMVEIAAGLGVGLIGPISAMPGGWVPETFDLRPGQADFAAMKAALASTGVRINNVDGATLAPENDWDDLTRRIEGAADLGARGMVTLSFDDDAERYFDGYCRLAEMTGKLGLILVLEFTPLSQIPDLAAACALVKRAGFRHSRVLVDIMHLQFSGGTPQDMAGLDDSIISGAQFCDGRLECSLDEYTHDALMWRGLPGEGGYPLVPFVRGLPAGLPLALEIPRTAEQKAGMSPAERARRAVEATMALAGKI